MDLRNDQEAAAMQMAHALIACINVLECDLSAVKHGRAALERYAQTVSINDVPGALWNQLMLNRDALKSR